MAISDMARLLALAALWGGSFLLYRVVAPVLGAITAAEARVAIAGVTLIAWQAVAGPRFAWRGHVRTLFVVGLFNSALPFALFGYAARALPAGYLAIINATSPLFGALIARLLFGEVLTVRKLAGIALGLAGVAVLVGLGPVALDGPACAACAACVVAAASYGFAGNYTRARQRPLPPASMATGSQLAAAIVLAPLLPFEPVPTSLSPALIGATLVLAIACTSVAYLLYFRLIRDLGATRALTVTFLIPVFAIAWAWLVLGEQPTSRMAGGAALVIVATALVTRGSTHDANHRR
jgi:drug/metabolite transporter (DMT)-like permease